MGIKELKQKGLKKLVSLGLYRPVRDAPCPCGSGVTYRKCCGKT
jgi:uncharacterized protein YecA (UPF0149 family)